MQDFNDIKTGFLSKGSDGQAKFRPVPTIPFKMLGGDVNWQEYGATWISPKFNNGDFDYWIVRELTNMEEHLSEEELTDFIQRHGGKYCVRFAVVAPEQFKDKAEVIRSMMDEKIYKWENLDNKTKVDIVYQYHGGVNLAEGAGSNYRKLFKEVGAKAKQANFLFGFAMDRQVNGMGATGWDWLQGEFYPEGSSFRKQA